MSDCINGDIEHEYRNWTDIEKLVYENKKLKTENAVIKEQFEMMAKRLLVQRK